MKSDLMSIDFLSYKENKVPKEGKRTSGCLTSTPDRTASSAIAFDLTSLAITAGACKGIRYIEATAQDEDNDYEGVLEQTYDRIALPSTDSHPYAFRPMKPFASQ